MFDFVISVSAREIKRFFITSLFFRYYKRSSRSVVGNPFFSVLGEYILLEFLFAFELPYFL